MVREATKNDLNDLLQLYLHLHEDKIPQDSQNLRETWETIQGDRNHHIILNEVDGILVSSCVCVIIPNLTRNVRPYAFIENVVTHEKYRGRGYATECLNRAKEILAYELTALVHGEEKATKAQEAARALFSGAADTENMPTVALNADDFTDGQIAVNEIMLKAGLVKSKGEARRLIQQGGVSIDDQKVTDPVAVVSHDTLEKGHIILKKGKKVFYKVMLA